MKKRVWILSQMLLLLLLLCGCENRNKVEIKTPGDISLPSAETIAVTERDVDIFFCNASWMKGFVSTDRVYAPDEKAQIRFEEADHPYDMIHDLEQGTEFHCTLSDAMNAIQDCIGSKYTGYLLGQVDDFTLDWMNWEDWADFRGQEDSVNSVGHENLKDIFSSYGNCFKYHKSDYPYYFPGTGGKKAGPLRLLLSKEKEGCARLKPERLSLIITDLSEPNLPFNEIAEELNERFLEKGGAVCLMPIKCTYYGHSVTLNKNDTSKFVTGKVTEPRLLFFILTGPKDEVYELSGRLAKSMKTCSLTETEELSADSPVGAFTRLYFPSIGEGIGTPVAPKLQIQVKKNAEELLTGNLINSCVQFSETDDFEHLNAEEKNLRVFRFDNSGADGYYENFAEKDLPGQLVLYYPIEDDGTEYEIDKKTTELYYRAVNLNHNSAKEDEEAAPEKQELVWETEQNEKRLGLSIQLSKIHADAESEEDEAETEEPAERHIVYHVENGYGKADSTILEEGDYLKLVIQYDKTKNERNASELFLNLSVRCGNASVGSWIDEWNTNGEYEFDENVYLNSNIDATRKTQGLKTFMDALYEYGYPTLNAPILLTDLLKYSDLGAKS